MVQTERCSWCGDDPTYVQYHDQVWGRPIKDPQDLFAKLCLDGQQAGLSWITILKKQQNYERCFYDFDPVKIIRYVPKKIDKLMLDPGIIRNRLKIESIVRNARAYLRFQEEGDDFAEFLWHFVDGKPIQNSYEMHRQLPAKTKVSEAMSKALKKKGFNFCGPTITYAFMQATGMVNDHLTGCPQYRVCQKFGESFTL